MPKYDLVGRGFVVVCLGLLVSLGTPRAFAKGAPTEASANEKKRLLVGGFTGTKSAQVRKSVIAALKEGGAYDVAESSRIKPGSDDKAFASASDGAAAVLVGSVKKTVLVLSLHNGSDGALIQDLEIKGESLPKLNRAISETLSVSIADAMSQTKASSSAEATPANDEPAKPEAEKDAPAETSETSETSAAADTAAAPSNALTPLELTVGIRAVHRGFSYHDTPDQLFPQRTGLLKAPTYNLPLGPALFVDATVYPFAFGSRGAPALFGLTGGYEINIATKSAYGSPERTLTTRASQFYAGLKGRIPIAAHEVGIVAAYGQQEFKLQGDETLPQVPDVLYKFVRFSAEGRFRFDALTLGLHAGARWVRDTGGLEKAPWFPGRVKTQAFEAGVSAGYTVATGFDLLFGLDLTRYAFNFNPQPAGANPYTDIIAGGAVDQYISGSVGLRYSLAHSASP